MKMNIIIWVWLTLSWDGEPLGMERTEWTEWKQTEWNILVTDIIKQHIDTWGFQKDFTKQRFLHEMGL